MVGEPGHRGVCEKGDARRGSGGMEEDGRPVAHRRDGLVCRGEGLDEADGYGVRDEIEHCCQAI